MPNLKTRLASLEKRHGPTADRVFVRRTITCPDGTIWKYIDRGERGNVEHAGPGLLRTELVKAGYDAPPPLPGEGIAEYAKRLPTPALKALKEFEEPARGDDGETVVILPEKENHGTN